ncbi:MAG: EAL domain-containing protein [Pirellulales bacterium]
MIIEEKNRRILIVDDMQSIHDDVRAILAYSESNDTLSKLEESLLGTKSTPNALIPYEIDSSFQGQDGLEQVSRALKEGRPYALAIVDIRMPPGWDGVTTIEKIREIDSNVQVAICSAYSDYSWQAIHERFGTNDWLLIFRKPFDLAEVQQFACSMTEKWNLARRASLKFDELETMVEEHARQLRAANTDLQTQNASLADANQRLSKEVEARRLADDRIQHMAFHDALTDLPNRAFLMDRLNECIERSKRELGYIFAVLFTDIDDFKTINDSMGHRVGDQVLSRIAAQMLRSMRTMQDSIRPVHDTVARLGGDEFMILLDDLHDPDNAANVAKRIQEAVCTPFALEFREIVPSISIGVAVGRNEYDEGVEIMRDADTALYHAKEQGKGRVAVFDQTMRTRVLDRLDLESDLRRAIEGNQFVVYYQPIVSLIDGSVPCLEALVRWQHPTRGLLLPDSFLPAAEESHLIEAISERVLDEASGQLSAWQARFPLARRMAVSVNLSACQLVGQRFVQWIDRCLIRHGLEPSSLKIELTESMMMTDLAAARRVIEAITSRGIEIYLDDFGSGYSSLSMLHTLPFAAIKLDRGFVSHLVDDVECQTTIQAMVMLAKNRNMRLIAEGIETSEQLVLLQDLECELGQGYFFSCPVPPQALEPLLASRSCYSVDSCELVAGAV